MRWVVILLLVGGCAGAPRLCCHTIPRHDGLIPVVACDNEADPALNEFPNDPQICTPVVSFARPSTVHDVPAPMVDRTGHDFEVYCDDGWVYFMDQTEKTLLAKVLVRDCGTWGDGQR